MSHAFGHAEQALEPTSYEVSFPGERQELLLQPYDPGQVGLADSESYDRFYNRARKIWEATAQGDLVSSRFVLDLAGSGFDDDQIIQLAHAHRRFLQDRSVWGRIRSIGAEPFDWLNNATEFVIRNTVDQPFKWALDDETASAAGALWIAATGRGDDFDATSENMEEFIANNMQSGVDQALYFATSIATDPTNFILPGIQIAKSGRIISTAAKGAKLERKAQKLSRVGRVGRMIGFRTDPDLVIPGLKTGRGEVHMTALEAFRSGRLAATVKARLGLTHAERRVVEDILLYGKDRGSIQSILPDVAVNTPDNAAFLNKARNEAVRAAGGEEALRTAAGRKAAFDAFVEDYGALFDGRRYGQLSDEFNRLAVEHRNLTNTLAGLDRIVDASRVGARSKTAAGSRLLEQHLLPTLPGVGAENASSVASLMRESLGTRFANVSERLNNIQQELGVFSTQDILPRRRWGEAVRRWADERNPTMHMGDWDPPFRKVTEAVLGRRLGQQVGQVSARAVESITQMSPHANIRVQNPNWPEQVRRLGQEYERSLPGWTRVDTRAFVDDANRVRNPTELKELLVRRQREAFGRLGLNDNDINRLVSAHAAQGTEVTRNIVKGKGTTEALFGPQFLNEIAVMDPRLIRAASRHLRLSERGAGAQQVARALKALQDSDVSAIVDAANSTWKSLAAARPAYLFRVVMLSEVGRMTAAGGVTPIGSPLAWLNASFPGRGGKLVRKFSKVFDDAGVDAPAIWDDLDAAGLTPERWSLNEMISKVKAPKDLGSQFNPQRTTTFLNTADTSGLGVMHLDDLSAVQRRAYLKRWRKVLVEDVAPDPMVQLFWSTGGRTDDARRWLKTEGRAYALDKGIDPDDGRAVRAFIAKQRAAFDHYTNADPNLISRLSDITLNELRQMDPPASLPGTMVSRFGDARGAEAIAGFVNDSVLGKMWDLAGWFSHQVARKGPYRHEFVAQAARQWGLATKAGAKADLGKILRSAAQEGKGLNAAERAIFSSARNGAERFVKQTVYDLSEAARWTDLARYIAPFSNAWQEEISRWMQIFLRRPGTPGFMWSSAHALMENPGFTWEDPTNGRKYIMVPFSEEITSFATGKWNPLTKGEEGLSMPVTIAWDNINMLSAGGAFGIGAGPWLQVPAEVVAKYKPEWRNAIKSLFPYADESILNTVVPTSVLRAWTSLDDEQEIAQRIRTVTGYYLNQDERPPQEVIESQVTMLGLLNAGFQFIVGGGARADLPPNVREEVSFYQDLADAGSALADRAFLESGHGEALAAWMTATVEAAKGDRAPATTEAVDWLLNPGMKELADKYPESFWRISSELLPQVQKYDPIELDRQMRANELNVRSFGQFMDAWQTRIGWAKYGLMLDAQEQYLREQGITSKDAKAAEPVAEAVRQYREALFESNPAWADSYHQWSERGHERVKRIQQFSEIIQEPQFASADVSKYLREYFSLRRQARAAMTGLGYKSLDTQEAAGLRNGWVDANQMLLNRYPELRPFYERNLRFDPMDFDA